MLKTLVQIAVNTLGAGYAASMYNNSLLSHAAAGAVGSFATEMLMSVFYLGFNDWKQMTISSVSVPLVSALSILLNDQLGITTTYIAIGVGQTIFALIAYYR